MDIMDKSLLDPENIPQHVAIIMDGNGRWAKQKGKLRTFGHLSGVKSVREVVEGGAELGVRYITLYAFSTENWNRPKLEIRVLMELFVSTIAKETKTLNKNNIRLKAIGNLTDLPSKCQKELQAAIDLTANNTHMTLILALSYSSKWEITNAVKQISEKVKIGELAPENIDQDLINDHLATKDIPDPELMIRTSGEHRVSNFLLWQMAYSEFYFTDVLWPDFKKQNLCNAIVDFQNRERRFGKTSEQID
jgi:undecaprenyl diphosphate synthase